MSVAYFGIKFSPHRPFFMELSGRLYHCARCHKQNIICQKCDRGQRYCPVDCRAQARAESIKRAKIKHQQTHHGRLNNAQRQARFRARLRKKVTDHSSTPSTTHAVLRHDEHSKVHAAHLKKSTVIKALNATKLCCHFCGLPCGQFLRNDFLGQSRFKQTLRRQASRIDIRDG